MPSMKKTLYVALVEFCWNNDLKKKEEEEKKIQIEKKA